MDITSDELLMYEVMKAIYDSGIPMEFKGSMVMKACLMEAGYSDATRHTVDVDANWISELPPTAEQMKISLQKALKNNNINLDINLFRMYGEGRSAGFEFTDNSTGNILFSMDIDVNRPVMPTQLYEIEGFHFRGVTPSQMLADKISVVSTNKVFRRIKDVIDIYYFSKVFELQKDDIIERLENSNRTMADFDGFLHRVDELKHAYEKFRFTGDVFKPDFEEIYVTVKMYIVDFLPNEDLKF